MNRALAILFIFCVGTASPGFAETLQDALAAAYRSNPTLQSQRMQQQALDETYVQAKAGLRPTASATLQAQYEREPNSLTFSEGSSAANYGYGAITVSQPIYTGGRTVWAVRTAEATVAAGRETLRSVESQVLMSVIQGYVDVLRDQQVLGIRQADLTTLQRQFAESSAKFPLGQATKTDVAQAQAQLEAAKGSIAAAEAQLQISRSEFQAAVGEAPGDLAEPSGLSALPATVDKAFELAEEANPLLKQSRFKEKSSRAGVQAAMAGYRPSVNLQGSFGYIGPAQPLDARDYAQDVTAGVTLNVPILTGGVVSSQVRQAKAENGSDRAQIEVVRREVIQAVSQAWNLLLAGDAGVKAGEAQVQAAETALKGAQAEYGFGLRTTLEVLISDLNLRAAQLALAQSRHDAFLARAAVLEVTGALETHNLLPTEPTYDPKSNFDRVKGASGLPWEGVLAAVDGVGTEAAPPP